MWLFTHFFNQCSNLNPLRTLFSDVFWGSMKWAVSENGITERTSWYPLSNLISHFGDSCFHVLCEFFLRFQRQLSETLFDLFSSKLFGFLVLFLTVFILRLRLLEEQTLLSIIYWFQLVSLLDCEYTIWKPF